MKTLLRYFPLFAGLVLFTFGTAACKKEDGPEGLSYENGVPFYHFTDNDWLWLRANTGDEWKMQNALGYQRVYRVQVVSQFKIECWSTSMGIPSTSTLLKYNDQVGVRFYRVDSTNTRGGAQLYFYRDAAMLTNLNSGGHNRDVSEFYAEGTDYEFVGNTDLISDYFHCRGMKFPRGAALNGPFQQLTVRGRQYSEVISFIGTARGATCAPVSPFYMQEMYYDRQAGLVRMVSVAGEVWDRVP